MKCSCLSFESKYLFSNVKYREKKFRKREISNNILNPILHENKNQQWHITKTLPIFTWK